MTVTTAIKAIQDIMRKDAGVDGDAQRLSQLGWMLFLKIFDDQEKELEATQDGFRSPIPKRFRWREWAANPEGITGEELLDFINNDLFRALKAIQAGPSNPRGQVVRTVFEDSYNYMKNGTLLRQVVNKINEIDFNSTEDRHLFGDIYEQILKDLQSAGNAGEYYTPRAVTRFMVDRVDPQLGEKVLDPACGTGGFLANTIEHVRSKYVKNVRNERKLQESVNGVEKKQMPHLLCVTNMLLHGIEVPSNIKRDNTLARPLVNYGPADRVDVIVTNPPFGGMEEDGVELNFPGTYRTKETADLFLVLIVTLLKNGGRGAIVLPDGTLFGEGVKTRIKEMFLTECNLHTIVRLPKGVFNPYTSINTNLLFFTKGVPTKSTWYYEHPYPEGAVSYNKGRPISFEEFAPEIKWWNKRKESEFAWKVDIKAIKESNYNLDIKNPNVEAAKHRDPEELLAEYQKIEKETTEIREKLKKELMDSLGGKK